MKPGRPSRGLPPKPIWLSRVAEIRQALQEADVPFVDRAAVEDLFRLRRRQAIHLLEAMEGFKVGRAFVAPRASVLAFLNKVEASGAVEREVLRQARVRDAILEARRSVEARRLTFRVPKEQPRLASLPAGVHLEPGRLEVTCTDAQDLLKKLFLLSKAVASDVTAFESLVGSGGVGPEARPSPSPRGSAPPRLRSAST